MLRYLFIETGISSFQVFRFCHEIPFPVEPKVNRNQFNFSLPNHVINYVIILYVHNIEIEEYTSFLA